MKIKFINIILLFSIVNINLFAKDISIVKKTLHNDQNNIINYNKKKLTLIDILNLSLQNNPQVKEAWLNIDVSKYSYRAELSKIFPTITGEINYNNNKNKYNDNNLNQLSIKSESFSPSVSLSYLLFDFGGRTADILNFKYKLNSIKYETSDFIQNFIYQVAESYYKLFSSLANERASKETESSSYEAFKAATVRYDIGLAPLTDKLQAETYYTQKRLTREKAENDVKIKKASLNYLLNLSPLVELDLAIPFLKIGNDHFEDNIANLIGVALKNRPDLKSYYENKKSKKAEVYKNGSKWLPSVSLTASYGMTNDRIEDIDKNNYNFSISASMPFFTGGLIYNNVAKTRSELKIINQRIKDLEKNIELDVWTAYQDFITSKRTHITSETLLKSATETEKTILGRYKNGKSSILDLLDAQSNLANARYEFISAQHNWFISRANLVRALGQMDVSELETLMNSTQLNNNINNESIVYNNNQGV